MMFDEYRDCRGGCLVVFLCGGNPRIKTPLYANNYASTRTIEQNPPSSLEFTLAHILPNTTTNNYNSIGHIQIIFDKCRDCRGGCLVVFLFGGNPRIKTPLYANNYADTRTIEQNPPSSLEFTIAYRGYFTINFWTSSA